MFETKTAVRRFGILEGTTTWKRRYKDAVIAASAAASTASFFFMAKTYSTE